MVSTGDGLHAPRHTNDVANAIHHPPQRHLCATSPKRPRRRRPPTTTLYTCHVTQTTSRTPSTTTHNAVRMPHHPNDVAGAIHDHPQRLARATSPKRGRRHHPPPPTTPSMHHITQTMLQTPSTTHHDAVYAPSHPNNVAGAVHDHPNAVHVPCHPNDTANAVHHPPRCRLRATMPHDAIYAPRPPMMLSMCHDPP